MADEKFSNNIPVVKYKMNWLGGIMFGGLGGLELGIILVIVVIIFGAGKIPELGTGMGKAITNFKRGIKDNSKKQLPENKEGTISNP